MGRFTARSLLCVLMVAGAGSSASSQPHGQASPPSENFGRMFNLPPFAPQNDKVTQALIELGRPGGLMDANDDLKEGAFNLIVNPLLSKNNPNNDAHTAGVTFMGQFLDHDMTFDTTSRLGKPANPRTSPNARRPYLDLDSVYGDGPVGSPLLYEPADRAKLRVEFNGPFEDVPRDANGTAVIADPRNDENLVISGLQAAFLLFHNRVVDLVREEHPDWETDDVFQAARQLTTWHYQWMILHEFLPAFTGRAMVNDVLDNGCRFYTPEFGKGYIPVEFQMAYRFGHSMVRPSYRANFTGNGGGQFLRCSSKVRPARANLAICAAASAAQEGSSAGRRSSCSLVSKATSARTSDWTQSFRRRSSICPSGLLRRERLPRRWRHAICCDT